MVSAPSNLTVSDDTTEDELTVSWDSVSDAAGYFLYRAEGSIDNFFKSEFDDMSPWTISNGGQASDRTYNGANSYYSGADGTNVQASATPYSNGSTITHFEYFYQETSNSTGGGVRLVNSNGNYEGGTATDNPQYDVDFADVSGQVSSGGNYDEWVHVAWTFDWANTEVTVDWEGLSSGVTYTDTYTLKQGVDVSTIELWNYNGGTWGSNNLDMWWDSIIADATQVVDTTNTSYTDTSLEDGETYYYRVSSYEEIIQASGGSTVTEETINGTTYKIHAFENTGTSTFSVTNAPSGKTADALVVSGGAAGGGADGSALGGGGGGAGGVIYDTFDPSVQDYTITVGAGGVGDNGDGEAGGDSSLDTVITTTGGGGGAGQATGDNNGGNGGSGGGARGDGTPGSGTSGQGNDGGFGTSSADYGGGGGGGKTQVGADGTTTSGGDGGDGGYYGDKFTDSFGENGNFGGGGGGGITEPNRDAGVGGVGGGGDGGAEDTPGDGTANTGGGGGGVGGFVNIAGGDGGSGIVLIRYEV